MRIITIKHKGEKGITDYPLYTKAEADEKGIKYVPWQDAEAGDMALSDDGFVGQCIATRWYKDHADRKHSPMNKWIRTCYGTAYSKPGRNTQPFTVKDRDNYYSLSGRAELLGARRDKGRQIAKIYARTLDLNYAIEEVERKSPETSHMNFHRWCKTEEFKKMANDELTKLLAEKGFDRAKTLDLLKKATDMAEGRNNVNAILKIVEMLLKMHGIDKPTEQRTTKKLEGQKYTRYLNEATKAEEISEIRGEHTEVIEGYVENGESESNKEPVEGEA